MTPKFEDIELTEAEEEAIDRLIDGTPPLLSIEEQNLLGELEAIVFNYIAEGLGDIPFRGRMILDELTCLRQDDRDLMFNPVTTGEENL